MDLAINRRPMHPIARGVYDDELRAAEGKVTMSQLAEQFDCEYWVVRARTKKLNLVFPRRPGHVNAPAQACV